MDNRAACDRASEKHIREYADLLRQAAEHTSLLDRERAVLAPLLAREPDVVHLQSGHGLDDVDLVAAGARSVVGVDSAAWDGRLPNTFALLARRM